MALAMPSTTEPAGITSTRPSPARRRLGFVLLAVGLAGSLGLAGWRVATMSWRPIPMLSFVLELAGVAIGCVVAVALAAARNPRSTHTDDDRSEPRRYAFAIADFVERTRAADLHQDVRSVARTLRHPGRRDLPDVSMACVLLEGPRRVLLVVVATLALLVGTSPMPMPTTPALIALAIGVVGMSAATIALCPRRIRLGDRLRWSYSSLGEILVRHEVDGVAPRRWVGAVGTIVVLNLAVALRGMSDRWTHGLPPMGDDERVVAMVFAMLLALGSFYTLVTTAAPELDNAHLVARRLEERTARQSALGGAMCVGLIGLLAGVLPGSVDPADDDPARVEQVTQHEDGPVADD
jgi:hypothetical protein